MLLERADAVGDEHAFTCRWMADPNRRVAGEMAVDIAKIGDRNPSIARFGGLRMVSPELIVVDVDERARFSARVLRACVVPYASALGRSYAWARSATRESQVGLCGGALTLRHTFVAARSLWPAIAKRTLPHDRLPIDAVWAVFASEQLDRDDVVHRVVGSIPAPVPDAVFEGDEHPGAPRVSALVSTYDSEALIEGCLEDLVQQSLFARGELEVVVVDSCSPGDEARIVRRYIERYPGRVRLLRTREREGVYMAWNRAARAARGDYLTNANTDDRHHPDALERLADVLDREAETGLVYARSLVTHDVGADFASATHSGLLAWPRFERERLLHGCFIGPHPMWRKSVHAKVGWFDQRFVVAADYELWMRIAECFDVTLVEAYLGLYAVREDSIEHDNRDACTWETIAARELYANRAGVSIEPHRFPMTYLQRQDGATQSSDRQRDRASPAARLRSPSM